MPDEFGNVVGGETAIRNLRNEGVPASWGVAFGPSVSFASLTAGFQPRRRQLPGLGGFSPARGAKTKSESPGRFDPAVLRELALDEQHASFLLSDEVLVLKPKQLTETKARPQFQLDAQSEVSVRPGQATYPGMVQTGEVIFFDRRPFLVLAVVPMEDASPFVGLLQVKAA